MLKLAIDLDDVVHNPHIVRKGYKMGIPMPGAVEAMQKLKKDGHIIVIHSIWADTEQKCEAISKWCRYFLIPYDFITNIKPNADVFLDNKAIRFTSWNQALEDISRIDTTRE